MRFIVLLAMVACSAEQRPPRTIAKNETPQISATIDCVEPMKDEPGAVAPSRFESRSIGRGNSAPRYSGRAIDLDLKDADIGNVCRLLADVGKVNIVLGDGVHGKVTLTMRHVPWDQAFDAVIAAKGLRAERDGNVIVVFAK